MKLLSSEEQQVFIEQVEKLKALKLSSNASKELKKLLVIKNPYEYFTSLNIEGLYSIYYDINGTDKHSLQTGCRFHDYEIFLIWTMLEKHADGEKWPKIIDQGMGSRIADDLYERVLARHGKDCKSLLMDMEHSQCIHFIGKIDHHLAAPLLVMIDRIYAAEIIDALPSQYPTTELITSMMSLDSSNSKFSQPEVICCLLKQATIEKIFPTLSIEIMVKILTELWWSPDGQDKLINALKSDNHYAKLKNVFLEMRRNKSYEDGSNKMLSRHYELGKDIRDYEIENKPKPYKNNNLYI